MYKLVFKKTKNITAKVDYNNEVLVTSPEQLDVHYIDEFVMLHFDKFYNFIEKRKNSSLLNINENKITLLGKPYELKINLVPNKEKYEIINNKIYLFLRSEENKKRMINKILHEEGHEYLVKKTKIWLKRINLEANSITTKWYNSKWGQCEFNSKAITLAIQLYMLHETLIDYVVIHEICHLVHPNHSSEFWAMVGQYFPEWKIARDKLKYEC